MGAGAKHRNIQCSEGRNTPLLGKLEKRDGTGGRREEVLFRTPQESRENGGNR